jgi:hypothetical protein
MQISHAEAHKLIQQTMDSPLREEDETFLTVHLQTCPECSSYRNEIRDVEATLRSVMNKHWNLIPAPLDMDALNGKVRFSPQGKLSMQLAMIGLMVMLVMLGTWRFVTINIAPTNTVQIAPIPTPSAQMTSTRASIQNCDETIYIVQNGETLESIALLFSTSPEIVMELNNLQSEVIEVGSKIKIPICFTPSATVRPVTFTVTFSPAPLTVSSP